MPFIVSSAIQETYTVELAIAKSWAIRARCPCGREKVWPVAELGAFPPSTTMQQIADRLACQGCDGAAWGRVSFLQDHATTRSPEAAALWEAAKARGQTHAG